MMWVYRFVGVVVLVVLLDRCFWVICLKLMFFSLVCVFIVIIVCLLMLFFSFCKVV